MCRYFFLLSPGEFWSAKWVGFLVGTLKCAREHRVPGSTSQFHEHI